MSRRRSANTTRPADPRSIESLNARNRRAARAHFHFPTEQAALTCLHPIAYAPQQPALGRRLGFRLPTTSRSPFANRAIPG